MEEGNSLTSPPALSKGEGRMRHSQPFPKGQGRKAIGADIIQRVRLVNQNT